MNQPDWVQWHRLYETPERVVAQRLLIVQRLILDFLASRAGDEIRVVSMCSGQGRDILGVLADHLGVSRCAAASSSLTRPTRPRRPCRRTRQASAESRS